MLSREEQIAARREQMPRSCRRNYDKALGGRSLRAAVNAFCLECVCWNRREVRLCTDLACPLYVVRPYQQGGRDGAGPETPQQGGEPGKEGM